MKKLNLGCGRYPKDGFVNVDVDPASKADVLHDLERIPYPFSSGEFNRVDMDHVLEHLGDVRAVMAEVHRLLEPGGELHLSVPHFSRGFTHWDHKRGFDVSFPLYFDPTFTGGYTGIHFECLSTRLCWFAQPKLKRTVLSPLAFTLGRAAGTFFDLLGNAHHLLASRLFCFWVGGYEEIRFVFRKPA